MTGPAQPIGPYHVIVLALLCATLVALAIVLTQ